MEEVLRLNLPVSLDQLQESFAGFDSDDSAFGQILSRRLGYMEMSAGSWAGNEAEGMRREVRMVVKCPPKPMLPDTTRVQIRHRLQRLSHERLILEREVVTLDVPYGDTWSLQERWCVTAIGQEGGANPEAVGVELAVYAHICFRSKGMLSSKIRAHALKRSRKCANLAATIIEDEAAMQEGMGSPGDSNHGEASEELLALREAHNALMEETNYLRRQLDQLKSENRSLVEMSKHIKKGKKELLQQIASLESTLTKERMERQMAEVALSEAYSQTLKELVQAQESQGQPWGGRGPTPVGREGPPSPRKEAQPGRRGSMPPTVGPASVAVAKLSSGGKKGMFR